jgi:hypothetical protein
MTTLRTLGFAAVLCGGTLALSGCHHQETGPNGVPFPAPQAPLSAQAQIQQVENDPHIPAAQKPSIEAQIIRNNKGAAGNTPAQKP